MCLGCFKNGERKVGSERTITDSRSTIWERVSEQNELVNEAVDRLVQIDASLGLLLKELLDDDVEIDRGEMARYLVQLKIHINKEVISSLVAASAVEIQGPRLGSGVSDE